MHNLLSDESKKRIKKEYRLRLLVVFLALSFLLGIIFFLSLLPSYIFSVAREKTISGEKKTVKDSVVSLESEDLNLLLRETKEKVDSLKAGSEDIPLHMIIEKVQLHKSPGISHRYTVDPQRHLDEHGEPYYIGNFNDGVAGNHSFRTALAPGPDPDNAYKGQDLNEANFWAKAANLY